MDSSIGRIYGNGVCHYSQMTHPVFLYMPPGDRKYPIRLKMCEQSVRMRCYIYYPYKWGLFHYGILLIFATKLNG
ncbi:hypothetical protein M066_2730 [Bacteroides fragilis str. I1345]|nr:hypothetical protein M066_2730 [Bacteroides fragilis str. I1345]RHF30007.1 hypothetical protein DW695_00285 [Bacteroides fragilis]